MRTIERTLLGTAAVLILALPPPVCGAGQDYDPPSAEEAIAFFKSLPPVGRRVDGKPQLVQVWENETAVSIRKVKEIKPGGHIEGGAHLRIEGDDWRYFTALESLEVAELWEIDGADDRAFHHLGHMPSTLESLSLEGARISAKGLEPLRNLWNLKVLRIGWSNLTDRSLEPLQDLKRLRDLLVSGNKGIKGSGFKHLAGHPSLKSLKASGTSLDDGALEHIGRIPSLAHIDISRSENLTGSGLRHLAGLDKLEMLELQRSPIRNSALVHLQGLSGLRTLNLTLCKEITVEGLRSVPAPPPLERLELSGTSVDDGGLAQLAEWSSLEHINVNACSGVTGASAPALAGMPNLKVLNLSNCSLTNETLPMLASLRVKELVIGHNAITPEGIRRLLEIEGSLPNLTKLHVWHIGVPERGKPSDEAVAPLKALRPEVEFAY